MNLLPSAATLMDPEIIILNEVSQKDKDKYHGITYMWDLKYGTNEPVYKTEIDSQTRRIDLLLPKGSGGKERDGLGIRDWQM